MPDGTRRTSWLHSLCPVLVLLVLSLASASLNMALIVRPGDQCATRLVNLSSDCLSLPPMRET